MSPSKIHLHWIQAVQEYCGADIQIMNNNGQTMPIVDTMRWTIGQHSKQFQIHHSNSRSRVGDNVQGEHQKYIASPKGSALIIHRIRTSVTLSEIKNIPKVYRLLRDNNCFLTEHRWTEDIWDTTQLGFVMGLDPQFYDVASATEKLRQEIQSKLPARTKIPKFQLAFTTPQIKHRGKTIKTKAYAIETSKMDSMELLKTLKRAYSDTHEFVPFQLRSKHPEAYVRFIRQQTQHLHDNHVFIMNNVSIDAMYYMSDHIKAVPGIRDVIAGSNVVYDGRHKVLVNKAAFHQARNSVISQLQDWFETHVSADAKLINERFRDPPEVAPLFSDGYSSGEGTYLSSSINTAMSYAATMSEDSASDNAPSIIDLTAKEPSDRSSSRSRTWAQRVKGTSRSASASEAPSTSQTTYDEEYMSDLASSRAEVEELKMKLHQFEVSKESYQRELERQAEHQRREMDLKLQQQALELERQAENKQRELERKAADQQRLFESQVAEQRMEMERQLANQRQEFERQVATQQQEMDTRITRQVEAILQQRPSQQPTSFIAQNSDSDFRTFMAAQNRHMQMLTEMVMQMMQQPTASPNAGITPVQRVSEHTDTTEDHLEVHDVRGRRSTSGRKRQFLRESPAKQQASPVTYPPYASLPPETAESESDMSEELATQQFRSRSTHRSTVWTPENPYVQDPPSPMYPDHPSHPLHDCSKELSFDSSQIADDREQSSIHHSYYESTPGVLADDVISSDQLQDIASQHQDTRQTSIPSAEPHTEMRLEATYPNQEDQTRLARSESRGPTNPM